MKLNNLQFYFCLVFLFLSFSSFAQKEGLEIVGIVLESNTKQPVEFATILVGNKETKKPITGTTTDIDGAFKIESDNPNCYIEISFIGFQKKTINDVSFVNGKADLGTIILADNSSELDEILVRAEQSQTEFKLDKRVFNVGKDLSTTGASALEVLNNVPSVNVSIEGQISLRGSQGVQILINGKPSVIASEEGGALGTITADMIEKVEIITNPSAKYEAEGTSGIINIILKKEERKGINGSATINVGVPHNHSFGLSLNRRTEKFNLFSQLGAGYRELPNDSENINQNLENNTTIFSKGTEYRNEFFYNLILGTDYHINKFNVITLSGSFAYEIEDQPSRTDFSFKDATGATISEWQREEVTEATNPKYRYELQYKKDFKDDKEHNLLFSALGNLFAKNQSSEFLNTTISGADESRQQRTNTSFKEIKSTFKFDYTKPLSEKWKMEAGAQYVLNNVSNDYAVINLENEEWVNDPDLTNLFEYNQKVLGVYGTGAYETNKWGLKLGLRLENTDLSTLLTNTNKSNNRNFTDYFPSAHTSYKFTERFSIQAGYSRRIFRPRLWNLNPFFNIRNNFSVRTGNPELLPEYTDSYEITCINVFGKMSLNYGVYHRYTTDKIERISTFEDNMSTQKPENIGTSQETGVELNMKYSPSKKLTFSGDFNYNYFKRTGEDEELNLNFNFNADQWTSKLRTKIKFPYKIDFEITGQYRSKYTTVQGNVSDNLFADLGLRKKILKGKGVLNLSVRDIFASRVRESEVEQTDFYIYSRRQRGRFITLGFSYGFGKGEAMEFSGQKRH